MGKNKSRRNAKRAAKRAERIPREQRRAEVITVIWMLSVFATLLALALAGVLALITRAAGEEVPDQVRLLPGLMLAVASLTGTLGLLLIYPTYRLRKSPPPRSVTLFAVAVCSLPLVIIFILAM